MVLPRCFFRVLCPSALVIAAILFNHGSVLAAGAGLRMSPSAGVFEVGSLIDVSLLLDTGNEAVNVVQAEVLFPADKLQVVNPATSTSFVSLWVQAPTFSNTDGKISLQGGVPNPGIKTTGGVISTATFRVKAPGKAQLRYTSASKVLRNDGEGTNILAGTVGAEFTLKVPPPAGPVVTSPTHPDVNQWYNNPNIQYTWEPTEGAEGYSHAFSQTAKQVPDDTIDTAETVASEQASSDGLWYFHVKGKAVYWGGVSTYPVQIDMTPPATFTPTLDQSTMTTDDVATLTFVTTDGASGIDRYEVKQVSKDPANPGQNTLFVETTSPFPIGKLPAGDYDFIVRALDRAGNATDATVPLTVVAGGLPFYARTPFFRNAAVANITLLVLIILAITAITLIILRRVRIRSTFHHDLLTLEHDAEKRAGELQRELEELQAVKRMADEHFQQGGNVTPPQNSYPPFRK